MINNLLSEKEISIFNNIIKDLEAPKDDFGNFIFDDQYDQSTDIAVSKYLGRVQFNIKNIGELFPTISSGPGSPKSLVKRLTELAESITEYSVRMSSITYVEYNSKYGKPQLPPHWDGDSNDLIINYQFASNTSWDIGIDFDVYKMEDNSAIIFNPNEKTHWRPHKIFNDGEYVKMIFFRFENVNEKSDYSHLQKFWSTDEVFKEIEKFRDSLSIQN